MIDAVETAVGSACSCVLEAGSDRQDRFLDVCCVGDTRYSFSEKNDSILRYGDAAKRGGRDKPASSS